MRCRQVRRDLLEYLEARHGWTPVPLTPDLDQIAGHLALCRRCAREAQQLQQGLERLPRRPEATFPPDLGARIQHQIALQRAVQACSIGGPQRSRGNCKPTGNRWPWPMADRVGLWIAGAVLLCGLLGLISSRWRLGQHPPVSPGPSGKQTALQREASALRQVPPSSPSLFPPTTEPHGAVEEAISKSQRVAQAYGYTLRDREKLAAICRAYYSRDRRSLASRGHREFAVRIATFACSRYEQAQEVAAVLDTAGLPAEIAPCRDGKVLVGVYLGPTSYEDAKSIHRQWPATVVVPYEEVNQARARWETLFRQTIGGVDSGGKAQPNRPDLSQPEGRKGLEVRNEGPHSLVLPALMWGLSPPLADYVPTHIAWQGWRIASSENLYAGYRYTRYPLTHLVDGDPRTAWVFSGTGKCQDGWQSRYALALAPEEPVVIDGLALMNGYNKSRELFLRNNRVAQIRLSVNGRILKTAALPDKMGWHKVPLPRQAVRFLQIELTRFYRGRDNDLCLSELVLLNRNQPIDLHLPQAVLFSKGRACGGGSKGVLISRHGAMIARADGEADRTAAWRPQGRYVAGLERGGRSHLWVADVITGQVIHRNALPSTKITGLRWKGPCQVEVAWQFEGQHHSAVFEIEGVE